MTKINEVVKAASLAASKVTPNNSEEALERVEALCMNIDPLIGVDSSFYQFYNNWLPQMMEVLTLIERNQRNHNGREMVLCLSHALTTAIAKKEREAGNDARTRAIENMEQQERRYMFRGDVELHKFYKKLVSLDWYYSYSDDNAVWNAGEASMKAIRQEAEEKGEKYVKLFTHVRNSVYSK